MTLSEIVFSEYAKLELEDAAIYYQLQLDGLGVTFKKEVRLSLKRILKYPTAWSVESGEIRKYVLHRFPYKILYSIEKDHLFVIAIAHQHQKPNYWVDRL